MGHQHKLYRGVQKRCRRSNLISGIIVPSLLLQITSLSTSNIFSCETLIRKILNPECRESPLHLFLHLMCCISCPSRLTLLYVGHYLKAIAEEWFTSRLVIICPALKTPMPVMICNQFLQRNNCNLSKCFQHEGYSSIHLVAQSKRKKHLIPSTLLILPWLPNPMDTTSSSA